MAASRHWILVLQLAIAAIGSQAFHIYPAGGFGPPSFATRADFTRKHTQRGTTTYIYCLLYAKIHKSVSRDPRHTHGKCVLVRMIVFSTSQYN
jgi:hypothetical protein